MRVVVDTHCWLWFFLEPSRLSAEALAVLVDEESEIYFSTVSAWEIVIKYSLGKLSLPSPPAEYIPSRLFEMGHLSLPVEMSHIWSLQSLPEIHKDPFDRLLMGQAAKEGIPLMTADPMIRQYPGIPLFWAG